MEKPIPYTLHNGSGIKLPYVKATIVRLGSIFLVSIICLYALTTQASNITASAKLQVFNRVKLLPVYQRVDSARHIYKINFRKVPEVEAMHALDSLTLLARRLDDLNLECAIYDMRADYYSVNTGFNVKSDYYYQQAVVFAQKNGLKLDEAIYLHRKAIYYSIFNHNATALQYFLDAQEIFIQIGFNHIPDIAIYLWDFANFYYSIGDYDECRCYLLQALQYNIPNLRNKINITNTLGLIYRNRGQYQQALPVFNNVLTMASAGKDTAWIGIAKGNIGSVYFMQNQYIKALPFIKVDYNISIKYSEALNGAISLLRLAQISLAYHQLDTAYIQLQTAGVLLSQEKTNVLKYRAKLYQLKAIYFEQKGILHEALSLRKQFESANDSITMQDNIAAVDRVNLRWQLDKHLLQLNQLKANAQMASFKMICVIVTLAVLLLIFLWIYQRRIAQVKKDQQILLSQKSFVDEELRSATSALKIYIKSLKNKNDVIEQFRKRIEEMQAHKPDQAEIENLNKMIQTHIMTDETWSEFKKLFNKVHDSFFSNLVHNFPKISVTDTRLLALVKLGLTNREMANMLGITVEGIKKAKQRLRKKMNLHADEDIENVINSF